MIDRPRRKIIDWPLAIVVGCVVVAAVMVYRRDGYDRFVAVFLGDLDIFLDVLPKILAGCLIGAFTTLLLPREMVTRWVGAESGLRGILIATVAGMLMPGGPLTIYPVAGAFLAVGADVGAALAFVTSWTLLGYARVLVWEMPFFGLHFTIWRWIVALPAPLLVGLLGRVVLRQLAARGYWKSNP